MSVLLVRALTLEGASAGLEAYVKGRHHHLYSEYLHLLDSRCLGFLHFGPHGSFARSYSRRCSPIRSWIGVFDVSRIGLEFARVLYLCHSLFCYAIGAWS